MRKEIRGQLIAGSQMKDKEIVELNFFSMCVSQKKTQHSNSLLKNDYRMVRKDQLS